MNETKALGDILIVEDNQQAREVLKEIISSNGYAATLAKDGREALSAIQRQRFCLIFLDLRLPEVNGVDLLRKVKETTSGVPVIVVSGYPEDLLQLRNKDMWPEMVISKPFKISQIREALSLLKER
ncbi:MAG: response regulator [Candidatus Tectomicrobia bacterium]|uniref:Response regulator n=1 Tax=Tectimicrobiota bacterium TaxID=2528274 RepID=A0A933GNE1_UNCTE|nr:response regulator [Candidatus Tectomicrobia bacterium]